ncbi:DUF1206 domain-containing protein [Nocardioides sp.]|uniref:DUF1206 domain-containing protein n=1 Tax=Nocardioides sp. TaxID=35761 RepID=UPI0027210B8E|nr:DUF1206 domain-containing protein [Nocardioides sp.]MDO9456386.1 DUF1206 domain-containing protein [Nocardioides sp.]
MSGETGRPSSAARQVEQSDWLDRAAQAGLVAFGVVHLLIGWLAIQLALGDREGSADSKGALQQLAEQPLGTTLVWLVAVGMLLLVVWKAADAAVGYREESEDSKRLRKRLVAAGKAVLYAAIAVSAIKVATGSGSSGGGTDSTTAEVMDLPGGQVLVGLVGLGIVAVGVALLVMAWKESYLKHLDGEGRSGNTGTAYRVLGRVGHVAKGIALGIVGGLFLYAAVTHEPKKSGGLDQALVKVLDQPFGPVLLTAMGLGFAAYGLFCFAEARHLDR